MVDHHSTIKSQFGRICLLPFFQATKTQIQDSGLSFFGKQKRRLNFEGFFHPIYTLACSRGTTRMILQFFRWPRIPINLHFALDTGRGYIACPMDRKGLWSYPVLLMEGISKNHRLDAKKPCRYEGKQPTSTGISELSTVFGSFCLEKNGSGKKTINRPNRTLRAGRNPLPETNSEYAVKTKIHGYKIWILSLLGRLVAYFSGAN